MGWCLARAGRWACDGGQPRSSLLVDLPFFIYFIHHSTPPISFDARGRPAPAAAAVAAAPPPAPSKLSAAPPVLLAPAVLPLRPLRLKPGQFCGSAAELAAELAAERVAAVPESGAPLPLVCTSSVTSSGWSPTFADGLCAARARAVGGGVNKRVCVCGGGDYGTGVRKRRGSGPPSLASHARTCVQALTNMPLKSSLNHASMANDSRRIEPFAFAENSFGELTFIHWQTPKI